MVRHNRRRYAAVLRKGLLRVVRQEKLTRAVKGDTQSEKASVLTALETTLADLPLGGPSPSTRALAASAAEM
jgi:hypothetical protein